MLIGQVENAYRSADDLRRELTELACTAVDEGRLVRDINELADAADDLANRIANLRLALRG